MTKYKTLKFGRCYINPEGDFVIGCLCGNKKRGYMFAGSHANPAVWLGTFQLQSRSVSNDGHWTEIDPSMFNVASALHVTGHVIKLPTGNTSGELPVISKMY
jgi:hypothetical protein